MDNTIITPQLILLTHAISKALNDGKITMRKHEHEEPDFDLNKVIEEHSFPQVSTKSKSLYNKVERQIPSEKWFSEPETVCNVSTKSTLSTSTKISEQLLSDLEIPEKSQSTSKMFEEGNHIYLPEYKILTNSIFGTSNMSSEQLCLLEIPERPKTISNISDGNEIGNLPEYKILTNSIISTSTKISEEFSTVEIPEKLQMTSNILEEANPIRNVDYKNSTNSVISALTKISEQLSTLELSEKSQSTTMFKGADQFRNTYEYNVDIIECELLKCCNKYSSPLSTIRTRSKTCALRAKLMLALPSVKSVSSFDSVPIGDSNQQREEETPTSFPPMLREYMEKFSDQPQYRPFRQAQNNLYINRMSPLQTELKVHSSQPVSESKESFWCHVKNIFRSLFTIPDMISPSVLILNPTEDIAIT